MFIMLFYVYWAIILALPLTEDGKPMNGVLCSDSFSVLSSNLSGQSKSSRFNISDPFKLAKKKCSGVSGMAMKWLTDWQNKQLITRM